MVKRKKPSSPAVRLAPARGGLSTGEIDQLIDLIRRAHPTQLEKIQKNLPVDVRTLVEDERVLDALGREGAAEVLNVPNRYPLHQLRILRFHLYENW